MIFDHTPCTLGEGVFWHPERQQLFWFDILENTLYAKGMEQPEAQRWTFCEHVSAAGIIDAQRLLIASETQLFTFDLETTSITQITPIEADNPLTRSNDGRTDPYGGFWIGTMCKKAEPNAGAIYRYYCGELRLLFPNISIPNAMCFSPNKDYACFADTPSQKIMKVTLDDYGWPIGAITAHIDLSTEGLNPDGAVIDRAGNLWNAQWGAHRVACYDPTGKFVREITFPAEQVSCPAFGGTDFRTLFATSATQGLTVTDDLQGATFITPDIALGQAENLVRWDDRDEA